MVKKRTRKVKRAVPAPGGGGGGMRRGGAARGGGLPGGMGQGNLMAQVAKMQEELERVQEELAQEEIEGSAGGGMVKVVVNGQQEILSITLDPEVVDPEDVEMLQDLIMAAIQDAVSKSKALAEERMEGLTGGMGLPF